MRRPSAIHTTCDRRLNYGPRMRAHTVHSCFFVGCCCERSDLIDNFHQTADVIFGSIPVGVRFACVCHSWRVRSPLKWLREIASAAVAVVVVGSLPAPDAADRTMMNIREYTTATGMPAVRPMWVLR